MPTTMGKRLAAPRLSTRWFAVWRRNFLVWQKLAIPSVLGNLADPIMYFFGLGIGLGALVQNVEGVPYLAFLAAGIVCFSTMNTAVFEALYSGFSRMHVQRTWDAILNAPVGLDDVVFAEMIWAASKALLSGSAILLIAWLLDLARLPLALWVLAVVALVGLCFAGFALVVTALAPSYDFFMYYFTLVVTPMSLVSGIFFPIEQVPAALRAVAYLFPLAHAADLVRPLLLGRMPQSILAHVLVLLAYALTGFYVALVLVRRRLLS